MTCSTCGGPLDTTSTTCPACGEAVTSPVGAEPAALSPSAPTAQAGRTGVGDAGEGPEDPWGRSGDSGGSSHGGGASGGQPPGSGGPPSGGGGAVPPGGGWGAPQPHPSGFTSEVRGWGIGMHLAGLIAALASAAVLGFVGPLLLWLLKREDHPFIDHHGKEALNFQITVLLALVVGGVLMVPAAIIGVITFGLGLILLALVALAAMVVWVVFPIVGAVKAANGEGYRYPISIRFIR